MVEDLVLSEWLFVFFLSFFTTVDHIEVGARGGSCTVGKGSLVAGSTSNGLVLATLKAIRVGVSGRGV